MVHAGSEVQSPPTVPKGSIPGPENLEKNGIPCSPGSNLASGHSAQAFYPFKQQLKVPAPAGTAFGRPEVHWADGELHLARGPCRSWTRDIEQLDAPAP